MTHPKFFHATWRQSHRRLEGSANAGEVRPNLSARVA